jgi:hypothetical protein
LSSLEPAAPRAKGESDVPDSAFEELQVLIDLGPTDCASLELTVSLCQMVLPLVNGRDNADSWAIIQTTLGNAFSELGALIGDRRFFTDAIGAFRAAMDVKRAPEARLDWAAIQHSLGATELRRSDLTGDPQQAGS